MMSSPKTQSFARKLSNGERQGLPFANAGLLASTLPLAHAGFQETLILLYTYKTQEDGGPGHPDAAVQSGAAKPWIAGAAPVAALTVNGTWT